MPPATGDEPYRRRGRLAWAALIKKVYEIAPLLCPFCGGKMKIIAFITEHATVAHILRHVGMPAQRPGPLRISRPCRRSCCTRLEITVAHGWGDAYLRARPNAPWPPVTTLTGYD